MRRVSYAVAAGVYAASITISSLLAPVYKAAAAAECATGYYPVTTNVVKNGDFAIAPSVVAQAGDPGTTTTTPGYHYSDASFYSQMSNVGADTWASDQGGNNTFSVQTGPFENFALHPELNQLTFPGDPAYGLPGTETWLYTNGNRLMGGEYLNWEQDVSGLVAGKQYVFVAYISSLIEPPANGNDDPTMRLRIGGTTGMPDGTVIGGPTVLTESATSNTRPRNGWQRVAFAFTATGSSEKLKITDSSTGMDGDDFALTAIGISECIASPDYTITLRHGNTPSQHGSYTQTVTVNNTAATTVPYGHDTTITLPNGYTVNNGATGNVALTNNPNGYICTSNSATPQVITCHTDTYVSANGSQSFSFQVAIGDTAPLSSTIQANVTLANETNTGNNAATDTITLAPDLKNNLTVTAQADNSITFKQQVTNIGTHDSMGPTTVVFTLPDTLVINNGTAGNVTIGGQNAPDWTCTSDAATPQKITCTHATIIRNLPADNQEFTLTIPTKNLSSGQQTTLQSTINGTSDSNLANNNSNAAATMGTPPAPAPQPTLASTGTNIFTVITGSLAAIAFAIAAWRYQPHRKLFQRDRM